MDTAPVGMALIDHDGMFLAANPQLCSMLGRDEAELLALTTLDVTHPDDVAEDLAYGQLARQQQSTLAPLDKRFVRPDGSIIWGRLTITLLSTDTGQPPLMLGQVLDITEVRAAERDREEHAWLQRIAGRIGRIGGWAVDIASGSVHLSDAIVDVLGLGGPAPPTVDDLIATFSESTQHTVRAAMVRCIEQRERFDLELSGRNFAGRRITVRFVGEPRIEDDRVVRIVGALQDVTATKAAEQAALRNAQELRNALEHMTDGVCALDHDWNVVYANSHAARMLDTTVDEMVGKNIWEQFPESRDSAAHLAYAEAMETRQPTHIPEYHNPRLDRWFAIDVVPTDRGMTAYFRDITQRRAQAEREARVIEAQRLAGEHLRRLDQMKNAFLTAVSHELRTPLSVVEGTAATLQRLAEQLTASQRRELTDALVDHTARLRRLLEDLLDLDRLTGTDTVVQLETFDLVALVGGTRRLVRGGDRLLISAPPHLDIIADRVQVERICANLVENAAKYASDGPIIVELERVGSAGARIGVHDTGPGIPDDELTAVFAPFHRADDVHPTPGTGVGLALVAQFAQLHGGRAWAESRAEGGAHVYVELPGPHEPMTDRAGQVT